jgi:hypothetical protein
MGHPRIARRGIVWKECFRESWDLDGLIDCRVYYGHTWGLHDRVCVVLSDCSLGRCILVRIATTLSEMSDACLLLSSHSNSTSIMLMFLLMMILPTLLVNEFLSQIVNGYPFMFR